jgi:hypothetical protein
MFVLSFHDCSRHKLIISSFHKISHLPSHQRLVMFLGRRYRRLRVARELEQHGTFSSLATINLHRGRLSMRCYVEINLGDDG